MRKACFVLRLLLRTVSDRRTVLCALRPRRIRLGRMCSLLLCLFASLPLVAQQTRNVAHQQYLGLVADPANVVKGSTFYRSDLDTLRFRVDAIQSWDGSAWVDVFRVGNCSPTTSFSISASSNAHACLLSRALQSAAPDLNFSSYHNYQLYFDAKDGGAFSSTSKVSYGPLRLRLDGRTQGQHILVSGDVFGYGIGDALFLGGTIWGYGGKNVTGTSQPNAEFAEINVKQGATVFTAQVSGDPASGATSINYASDANESVLGERALINTTKVSTAGTVTSISTDNVNFDATAPDWNAAAGACNGVLDPCNPVNQYFKVNADDVTLGGTATGHWYRVIAVVDLDTFQIEVAYDADLTTSGAYTLAQGAEITAFNTATNNLTIEANSYDWAAADNLISPPMPLMSMRGLNLILTHEFKTGTSRAINIANSGPYAWDVGLMLEGSPSGDDAYEIGINLAGKIGDGIRVDTATLSGVAFRLANNQLLRWGTGATGADYTFNGNIFTWNRGASFTSASASFQPLVLTHAASPTTDYFLVRNSALATIFSVDDNPDGQVNVKCAFGTGVKIDPAGPTVGACGTNTNIVLDLITKGTGTVRVNAQANTGTGGFAVYDGAATPVNVFSVSSAGNTVVSGTLGVTGETTFGAGGVAANGAGYKHGRVTTGSITAGSSAAVTLTWGSAFADANYTATCSVVEATASTVTLRLHHIESAVAGSVVVRIVNDDGVSAHTGTLHCTSIHD